METSTGSSNRRRFLGPDRESIGAEKAGVYRANQWSICGDDAPPTSLIQHAKQIGAHLKLVNVDYAVLPQEGEWVYRDAAGDLVLPKLAPARRAALKSALAKLARLKSADDKSAPCQSD